MANSRVDRVNGMALHIDQRLLDEIFAHGEAAYPEEGAGLLLGNDDGRQRVVTSILPFPNAREGEARHNRYLITAEDMLQGEDEAERRGVEIVGVFHSHPDHPNAPSEYDREWALPWYSYLITSIERGKAAGSRSWRLQDNRITFNEEDVVVDSR